MLSKWFSASGRYGPDRLAQFRSCPFGNVPEVTSQSFFDEVCRKSTPQVKVTKEPVGLDTVTPIEDATPALAVASSNTPVPVSAPVFPDCVQLPAERDGLRHRHVHSTRADESVPPPLSSEVVNETSASVLSLASSTESKPSTGFLDNLAGVVGAPASPYLHVAILIIFVVAFLFPMIFGMLGRILALVGLL